MMGDNRDPPATLAIGGAVDNRFIKGKARFICWPPARMRGVRYRQDLTGFPFASV